MINMINKFLLLPLLWTSAYAGLATVEVWGNVASLSDGPILQDLVGEVYQEIGRGEELVDFHFAELSVRNIDMVLGPLTVTEQSARTQRGGIGSVSFLARPGVRFVGITWIGMSSGRNAWVPMWIGIYDLLGGLVFETAGERSAGFSPFRLNLPLPGGGGEVRWTDPDVGLQGLNLEVMIQVPETGTLPLVGCGVLLILFGRYRCG